MLDPIVLYAAVSAGVVVGSYMGLRDSDEHESVKTAAGLALFVALTWPVCVVAFINEERRRARG